MTNVVLSAHYDSPTSAILSVMWWQPGARPALRLSVSSAHDVVHSFELPVSAWTVVAGWPEGADPPPSHILAAHATAEGLVRGAEYNVTLHDPVDGRVWATCQFETVPALLHRADTQAVGLLRPFTVLVGSCYYAREDNEARLARSYERLLRAGIKPHVKFRLGDQVYVDQPPTDFIDLSPLGPVALQERLHFLVAREYVTSWPRQGAMLTAGLNHHTTDDHEFWNDYPNKPLIAWEELSTNPEAREIMRDICLRFVRDVQHVRARTTFKVGPDDAPCVQFFALDTRMHRTQGKDAFVDAADFDALIDWIDTLPCPGVLVVGEPIFGPAIGRAVMNIIASDTKLPAYKTFPRLIDALTRCPHDVLVCGGDVHFGRLSTVRLPKPDGQPDTYLWEVISSALNCISTSKEVFNGPPRPLPGDDDVPFSWRAPETSVYFPPLTDAMVDEAIDSYQGPLALFTADAEKVEKYAREQGWQRVRYVKTVPKTDDGDATKDHFMTLSFAAGAGSEVIVDVSAWLVNDPAPDTGPPALAWSHRIVLDQGRTGERHGPHSPIPLSAAVGAALARPASVPVSAPPTLPVAVPATPPPVVPPAVIAF